jgi:serine/threonine-protein kinase
MPVDQCRQCKIDSPGNEVVISDFHSFTVMPVMAAAPSIDRRTFLAHIVESGLLNEEQVEEVASRLPESLRGRALARAFVEQGLLTRFQAERLLAGRTTGFHLGQYRILDQLGRGGMGQVYKAEHRTMNRIVALKVLSPNLVRTGRAQELFLREVRAVARLVHPNIVTAYDANNIQDRYYLVLEYIEGPNLDQLVREQGPLTIGQACDCIRQVALGLQYAHERGMVHRDIKPANILVQRDESKPDKTLVKISDFGLARLQSAGVAAEDGPGTIVTKDNTVMGTPDYLSPEQARSLHNVDIRSDLYSLGCTFYFLLKGDVPFPGGNTLEKLVRHSTENPQPIESFRSDVPAAVLQILYKLLAKDAEDRFQTPAELALALEPYATHGPTTWSGPVAIPFPSE